MIHKMLLHQFPERCDVVEYDLPDEDEVTSTDTDSQDEKYEFKISH